MYDGIVTKPPITGLYTVLNNLHGAMGTCTQNPPPTSCLPYCELQRRQEHPLWVYMSPYFVTIQGNYKKGYIGTWLELFF